LKNLTTSLDVTATLFDAADVESTETLDGASLLLPSSRNEIFIE